MKFTPELLFNLFKSALSKLDRDDDDATWESKSESDKKDIAIAAAVFQAAFDAWLKEQPVVYGRQGPDNGFYSAWDMCRMTKDTHTAFLVGIKRIGEEGE